MIPDLRVLLALATGTLAELESEMDLEDNQNKGS